MQFEGIVLVLVFVYVYVLIAAALLFLAAGPVALVDAEFDTLIVSIGIQYRNAVRITVAVLFWEEFVNSKNRILGRKRDETKQNKTKQNKAKHRSDQIRKDGWTNLTKKKKRRKKK